MLWIHFKRNTHFCFLSLHLLPHIVKTVKLAVWAVCCCCMISHCLWHRLHRLCSFNFFSDTIWPLSLLSNCRTGFRLNPDSVSNQSQKPGEFLKSVLLHQNQMNYANLSKCQPEIQRVAKQKNNNNTPCNSSSHVISSRFCAKSASWEWPQIFSASRLLKI